LSRINSNVNNPVANIVTVHGFRVNDIQPSSWNFSKFLQPPIQKKKADFISISTWKGNSLIEQVYTYVILLQKNEQPLKFYLISDFY